MLTLLSDILAVIAPVFLIAALGYGWARAGLPYSGPFITTFMINVATPCLVFATLLRLRFEAAELATIAGASLACLALSAAVAFAVLRLARLSLRIYLPSLIFPNSGNMGMPLCLFAFGEAGLGLAVVFFAVLAVAQFTLGPAIAAGRLDLRQMLRTPLVHAVALALLIQALGLELPRWAANTTQLLGDCAVPLMLLALGVALAGLRITGMGRVLALVHAPPRAGLRRGRRRRHRPGAGGYHPRRRDPRECDARGRVQLPLGRALRHRPGGGRRHGPGLDACCRSRRCRCCCGR